MALPHHMKLHVQGVLRNLAVEQEETVVLKKVVFEAVVKHLRTEEDTSPDPLEVAAFLRTEPSMFRWVGRTQVVLLARGSYASYLMKALRDSNDQERSALARYLLWGDRAAKNEAPDW